MSCTTCIPIAAGLLIAAQATHATGFFVNQQSVRALGRVNAGAVAAADDASTVFFNPAGLAFLWQDRGTEAPDSLITLGMNVVLPKSKLQDRGSTATTLGTGGLALDSAGNNVQKAGSATLVPDAYYARRAEGSRYFFGFGINAPFGQTAKFGDGGFGRYDAIQAQFQTLNLSAVGALWLAPGVALGGGIDLQKARTRLISALPNPLVSGGPSPATDGRSGTYGDGWAVGFNLGLQIALSERSRLGIGYRAAMRHSLSGTAQTSGLVGPLAGANGIVGAEAKLKLPAIWGIGLVSRATEKLSLYAQYDFFNWRDFDQIVVTLDDGTRLARQTRYRSAWAASVGAEYALSPKLTVRGGLRFDRTPTTDGYRDTTLPDADRTWYGVGASYQWSRATTIDVAFNHVTFRRAAVDVNRPFFDGTPLAASTTTRGAVNSRVSTISLGFSYGWH